MYKSGIMMNGYNTTGMMGGGMMGSNMHELKSDTATVNSYYRNMQLLHHSHQAYHDSICKK